MCLHILEEIFTTLFQPYRFYFLNTQDSFQIKCLSLSPFSHYVFNSDSILAISHQHAPLQFSILVASSGPLYSLLY